MHALLESLELSIADAVLTTAEKQSLAADLRARPLRIDQLRQLRNHAFDLVLARARDPSQNAAMPALFKWLNEVVKLIDQTATPAPSETEVWFSPGEECRTALIGYLQSSRQRVEICVFTIADDRITDAILDAHARGVVVRVISDDDKRHDAGSDIERLRAAGVAVALDDSAAHMHHKFAIFDGRRLVNGSFNWTRSASRVNQENLVATNDPRQLLEFSAEFETLWRRYAG